MRLDELDKRIDSIAKQVQAIRSTQDKKPKAALPPKPAEKSAAKKELDWRSQKPTEWRYDDGTPLISKRGLPVGWLDERNAFVALSYGAWNMKELRMALMAHRYDTPLFK